MSITLCLAVIFGLIAIGYLISMWRLSETRLHVDGPYLMLAFILFGCAGLVMFGLFAVEVICSNGVMPYIWNKE